MSTLSTSPGLVPQPDVDDALEHLLDLTLRQWSNAPCEEIVEHLLTRIGCTIHCRWTTSRDTATLTWLIQDHTGAWCLYRICTESFRVSIAEARDFTIAWSLASTDTKLNAVHSALADPEDVLRGATPNDLLDAFLDMDDINHQRDVHEAIDWLRTHTDLDLDKMLFLRSLADRPHAYDPDRAAAMTSRTNVTRHEPLTGFDYLPAP